MAARGIVSLGPPPFRRTALAFSDRCGLGVQGRFPRDRDLGEHRPAIPDRLCARPAARIASRKTAHTPQALFICIGKYPIRILYKAMCGV